MRRPHEDDPDGALEDLAEVGLEVVSREQERLLGDEAAQAVSDEDEGPARCAAREPVVD